MANENLRLIRLMLTIIKWLRVAIVGLTSSRYFELCLDDLYLRCLTANPQHCNKGIADKMRAKYCSS